MSNKIKKGLNITYLLGAGASYSAVPIWSEQATSMKQVADSIKRAIEAPNTVFKLEILESETYNGFNNNEIEYLSLLIDELNYFADKATQNSTIDSYAHILFKQRSYDELNKLKRILSIYLDIWQFYQDFMPFRGTSDDQSVFKDYIDKRYIQWLNLITQNDSHNFIKRNNQVNILSWNYDLQIELAFRRLYPPESFNCLSDIHSKFKYLTNPDTDELDIFHLNGHHGFFNYDKEVYSTASTIFKKNYYQYLKNLHDNKFQFKLANKQNYDYGLIKFSWEKEISDQVLKVAKNTDILIIIGYSFPQYNRSVDRKIIDTVKSNKSSAIVYQDPTTNIERVKDIINFEKFKHRNNKDEFYIPEEFLYPNSEGI